MITVTREEAGTAIKQIGAGDIDDVMTELILRHLESHGAHFARPRWSPCPHCGKPHDTLSCAIGGCPLGADL